MATLPISVISAFKTGITSPEKAVVNQIISGHINVTFEVTDYNDKSLHYIIQKVNHNIFKDTVGLMNNIKLTTDFVRENEIKAGRDPERCALKLVDANDGNFYYVTPEGDYYRCYYFLRNGINLDSGEVTQKTYVQAGKALADFERQLAGFDAEKLCEVIPNFHNTVWRYENFEKAIAKDASGRAKNALPEIEFAKAHKDICSLIIDGLKDGTIPLRVTHNDTKPSNIMIDADTKEVLCFIDLDTIMPGSALYDFGDALRAGGSSAKEDENDLSKVHFLKENFKSYCEGYIKNASDFLTKREIELLPESAAIMTFECGLRFLSDYCDGDTYFATHYEDQNLRRTRTQFKLVKEILEMLPELHEIVNSTMSN